MLNRTTTIPAALLSIGRRRIGGSIVGRRQPSRFLATTGGSPLQEYFVVVFNKKNAVGAAPPSPSIQFQNPDIVLTFAGDMLASPAPVSEADPVGTLGACFACQAPSEESVLQAIQAHENAVKGLWDVESVEISALETIHTGDFERERQ
ncbi:uncharacterized protein BP01DRAFT_355506 [Aspergillus saccharolyticus JOP 1030-1]|uniref:YCII-related domain-containing protein n=1 Tax=Aspergillus saccharolyticus JOP 1030-1 TaxID=1450539 RepID=A0A318ZG14_9EURO|nr:hypothetical protein BP01DRAFT_355506 [Aspergillus saccharolyticus JOP 1030-1]PYH46496.1 hypothetical protein BP01DRAFT_355506 [Aspergillus saccharolyticus JOP 1030-1]